MTREITMVAKAATPQKLFARMLAGEAEVVALQESLRQLTEHFSNAADEPEVRALAESLRPAAFGETDPKALRMALSLCLEAIPNARSLGDASIFLDAAVAVIMSEPSITKETVGDTKRGGFTTTMIARAVMRILRTKTFCPSIAEFVEALRAERLAIQATLFRADNWLGVQDQGRERARIRATPEWREAERKRKQECDERARQDRIGQLLKYRDHPALADVDVDAELAKLGHESRADF